MSSKPKRENKKIVRVKYRDNDDSCVKINKKTGGPEVVAVVNSDGVVVIEPVKQVDTTPPMVTPKVRAVIKDGIVIMVQDEDG